MRRTRHARSLGSLSLTVAVALLSSVLILFVACEKKPKGLEDRSITVAVSIQPQAYFVGRIGGNRVAVQVMVPPAQSPATYEPTPKQMANLQEADVYFRIGVPFENRYIGKIESIIGADKIIDTRQGITLHAMTEHSHEGDTPIGEHGEVGDPHIWLDPSLVKLQARTMADVLERITPDVKATLEKNVVHFLNDLDSVDVAITELLAPYRGRAIYVYHPSYGYFAERYGLRQVAVENDGREPSARELADLIDRARADKVTALFVQPQFAKKPAQAIASALDVEIVELDPLSGDYLNNLTAMARKIAGALETPEGAGE